MIYENMWSNQWDFPGENEKRKLAVEKSFPYKQEENWRKYRWRRVDKESGRWLAEDKGIWKKAKKELGLKEKSAWTIVNKKDTIFEYIFWERLDSLPIPECYFHFVWC